MKKTIIILIIFLMSIFSVIGVAPSLVENGENSALIPDKTFITDDFELSFSVLAIDPDSATLDCNLYGDFIDRSDVYQEDFILATYSNILNNTQTFEDIDFLLYQFADDIKDYNFTYSCTDGVDTINSTQYSMTIRGLFLYDEADISSAVINTFVKIVITIGLFLVAFLVIMGLIWGFKQIGVMK